MFIVNGEILSKTKTPDVYKWYKERIDEIMSSPDDIYRFSGYRSPHYETDDSGRKRLTRQYKAVPSTSTIEGLNNETQTWTYVQSANAVKTEGGISVVEKKRPIIIGNSTIFDKRHDVEIIFFLLNISRSFRRGSIVRIDERSENIEEAKLNAVSAKAQYLLYSDESPIHQDVFGSDKAIRQLALSWGVVDALKLHLDEVRNKLWDRILKFQKTKDRSKFGFKPFIEQVNNVKDSAKRANILSAINEGILLYEDTKWSMVSNNVTTSVCSVPPEMIGEKEEVVVGYLLDNPEYLILIDGELQKKAEEKKAPKANVQKKAFNRVDGINQAHDELGWPKAELYKMKNSKIEEIVNENIRKQD